MACYFTVEGFDDSSVTAMVREGFSPSVTGVPYLFHACHSALLLFPDFHWGEMNLGTRKLVSLHPEERFSSVALIPRSHLTEGSIADH